MKKLLLFVPLLVGCSSVKLVTTDHGKIVNEYNQPVNIVGRPRVTCLAPDESVIADGYFVYQNDDGSFYVDEFGKRYVTVQDPHCVLNSNERLQN